MARPPKNPSDRKDVDLRIPVTADQKRIIAEAAAAEGADLASWARPILLRFAEDKSSKPKKRRTH
jgi:uncharacterized protein (DUF1778 family)